MSHMHDKHEAHKKPEPTGANHQTFPQACVDAATTYWLGLDASHQYAFKGSNSKLFSQMAANPQVAARANEVFGGSAPKLDAPGQTTTGEPIYVVTEPEYQCP